MIILTSIFISFLSLSSSDCILDSSTAYISKEISLNDDLMKKYGDCHQVMENTTVTVSLRFAVKTFKFLHDNFILHSWAFLSWHDDHLTWNPEDYDGIHSVSVSIMTIWTPQIHLDNELEFETEILDPPILNCKVSYMGIVSCIPKVTHIIQCISVLNNWPYDTQTCTFNYTVKNNVKLSYPPSKAVSTVGAEYATGWIIVAYEYTHPDELIDTMSVVLTIERVAALLAAINVIPLVTVAVLCVTAIFIDVNKTLRVFMLCFSLACDFVFVQTINENIPRGGIGAPKVLNFLKASIFMTAITIVATFALRNLRKKTKPTPTWVNIVNDFLLKNSIKTFIGPIWDPELHEDDTIKKSLQDWNTFTYILNSVNIVTYIIIYFVLYLIYIPRPIPVIV
ncbi:acetylcholine receptor subunit beta-type unc-29-like [Aricia agestis]|uniref:acetylcholine receptor subunit beta-type unc-29-like n=1 Tax=Aricia agestis TaxID=91739 RepID=UPI001C204A98|nr:acetylcholine receptor subunit beta-type unc-29-like [Aricia agestis]